MSNIEKLLAIGQDKPWEKSKNNTHGKSNILLLREHLRRMLIWKGAALVHMRLSGRVRVPAVAGAGGHGASARQEGGVHDEPRGG